MQLRVFTLHGSARWQLKGWVRTELGREAAPPCCFADPTPRRGSYEVEEVCVCNRADARAAPGGDCSWIGRRSGVLLFHCSR